MPYFQKILNNFLSIKNNIVLLQVHKVASEGFAYPFKSLNVSPNRTAARDRPRAKGL